MMALFYVFLPKNPHINVNTIELNYSHDFNYREPLLLRPGSYNISIDPPPLSPQGKSFGDFFFGGGGFGIIHVNEIFTERNRENVYFEGSLLSNKYEKTRILVAMFYDDTSKF